MWMPTRHGGAQPQIIDGLPAMRAAFDECRRRFMPRCSLEELSDETYIDITESVGEPASAADQADAGGDGACTWERAK